MMIYFLTWTNEEMPEQWDYICTSEVLMYSGSDDLIPVISLLHQMSNYD